MEIIPYTSKSNQTSSLEDVRDCAYVYVHNSITPRKVNREQIPWIHLGKNVYLL